LKSEKNESLRGFAKNNIPVYPYIRIAQNTDKKTSKMKVSIFATSLKFKDKKMKKLPIGISDFREIREEDNYFGILH
jgi:hypothetical protein